MNKNPRIPPAVLPGSRTSCRASAALSWALPMTIPLHGGSPVRYRPMVRRWHLPIRTRLSSVASVRWRRGSDRMLSSHATSRMKAPSPLLLVPALTHGAALILWFMPLPIPTSRNSKASMLRRRVKFPAHHGCIVLFVHIPGPPCRPAHERWRQHGCTVVLRCRKGRAEL